MLNPLILMDFAEHIETIKNSKLMESQQQGALVHFFHYFEKKAKNIIFGNSQNM